MEKPERKLDRRAVRTRRALRDALMALILEKGFDAITVQDITDRADLNRGTLYLHYRDKLDLLIRSSEDAYDDLIAQFEPLRLNHLTANIPERHLQMVFDHVAANIAFYRVMIGPHGVAAFSTRLRQIVAEVGMQRLAVLRKLSGSADVPSPLIAAYVGGAIYGVLEWWLSTDMRIPTDALAKATLELTIGGVYQAAGIEIPEDLRKFMDKG